jgi:ABC-type transporter Mla maintaining outer membrane lipid asymmetry ATPase subunit MlaF
MNPEQPPAIEFRNVSISFDGAPALRNISFTLPRGEMLCVTGDSDTGKSVLLRLALGFLRPDEGQIWINGQETTAMEEDGMLALRRETMGMVFQDNSFFSGQTVYENITPLPCLAPRRFTKSPTSPGARRVKAHRAAV